MQTTEERLAALETKLAALTETTPTTYYEHQYSGEEIDNAVARALPNGAIDQAVGTFVRPNLLDNWYFEKPVNQRDGHISLQGVPVYNDAACTSLIGNQIEVAATCIKSGTNYERRINGHGGGFVKAEDVVRGYTGTGYTFDRWKRFTNTGTTTQNDGYISVVGREDNLDQICDESLYKSLRGKVVTLSILARGTLSIVSEDFANSYQFAQIRSENFTVAAKTITVRGDADRFIFHIQPQGDSACDIIAAKLELGSTQTLAHREGDKWVLNEVPEYGEQLRRCLRHDYIIGSDSQNCPIGIGTAYSNDGVVCVIQLPEYMRTNPAVVLSGEVQIRFSKTQILTATSVLNYGFSGDKVQLYFPGLSGLTPGQSCDLYTQIGSRLEFNSNL